VDQDDIDYTEMICRKIKSLDNKILLRRIWKFIMRVTIE
jgi:hypothetical protein